MNVIQRSKRCSHNGGKLANVGVTLSPAIITPFGFIYYLTTIGKKKIVGIDICQKYLGLVD